MYTLNNAKRGEALRVERVGGKGALRRRLMDMGLTKGAEVRLCRAAPFGGPLEIKVRGYCLAMGRPQAELIVVRKKGEG